MNRRTFITSTGATTMFLTGCLSGNNEANSSNDTAGSSGGQSINSHPAASNLAAQPRLGDLDESQHTIIAFKDPSCPRCRAFKESTVPEIKRQLIDPNKGAYILRNYPVVYPWGEPASQALEATLERSETAHWKLQNYYYDMQRDLSTENVHGKTQTFLESNTEVTASAVIADVKSDAYSDAVTADINAAERADLDGTTPSILLFRNGQYVTTAAGSISYDVIATALGEN
nr:thioredoxin domain-containing protein [Haloquadratum walsbyi]